MFVLIRYIYLLYTHLGDKGNVMAKENLSYTAGSSLGWPDQFMGQALIDFRLRTCSTDMHTI